MITHKDTVPLFQWSNATARRKQTPSLMHMSSW